MLIPYTLFTVVPIIIITLIFLVIEIRRPEQPDTGSGRLPVMILLLFPFSAGAIFLYFYVAYKLYDRLRMAALPTDVLMMSGLAVWNLAVLLIARLIARLLRLNQKSRVTSMIILQLLFIAEAFYAFNHTGVLL